MAVTLNGHRTIGFGLMGSALGQTGTSEFPISLAPGDVYVTTPAGILHGISVDNLPKNERSVALQCRTLLSGTGAAVWCRHTGELCVEIGTLLENFPLRIPTHAEWEVEFKRMSAEVKVPEEKMIEYTGGEQ